MKRQLRRAGGHLLGPLDTETGKMTGPRPLSERQPDQGTLKPREPRPSHPKASRVLKENEAEI
jgi:hypothetical protein